MTSKYAALAFFDLDGTLLDQNSQVTPEITAAMEALLANHVLPVIATGRTNLEIQEIMQKAKITSSITMNGQFVEVTGESVFSSEIAIDTCQRLLNMTETFGHELGFYTPYSIAVTKDTPVVQDCYGFIHSQVPEVNRAAYLKQAYNMLLIIGTDQDEAYHQAFPELTFYRNGPFSIDTVAKGGSKGRGIYELQKKLNLMDVPTYCFGDGLNDLSMFEVCDEAIAMGNGKPEVLERATFITKKNTEGGIIHALKHFDLI